MVQEEEGSPWADALSGLVPYLVLLAFVIFVLNVLLFPKFATRKLMKEYLSEGRQTTGQILSCESKDLKDSNTTTTTTTKAAGDDTNSNKYIVEVMYEVRQHKYLDQPGLRFRFPNAYETKRYVRRFEYDRQAERGDEIEILYFIQEPKSGCARPVIDRHLSESPLDGRATQAAVGGACAVAVVVLALAIREIFSTATTGYDALFVGAAVLVGGLVVVEAVCFLYCADSFLRSKRRKYDSAQPMLTPAEREVADKQRTEAQAKVDLDPFKVPLHEFAGHSRASERAVL